MQNKNVLTEVRRVKAGSLWLRTVAVLPKTPSVNAPSKLILHSAPDVVKSICRVGLVTAGVAALLSAVSPLPGHTEHVPSLDSSPIITRNIGILRDRAAQSPDKEADQVLINGWPLYRTERGQEAFNQAMATLKATEGTIPSPDAFKNCTNLICRLVLPTLRSNGWIPTGRLWISPSEYVLIVHSPRHKGPRNYRRRPKRKMRIFVFHEFHNSTRNIDLYDTISSHRRSVFVPFYMGKPGIDSKGGRFVIVMQVAPHDVVSRHASNLGNTGPGIEVAKNKWEGLAPLQSKAGIVIATIVKIAEPQLRIVRHRGAEGRPMLRAYQRRLTALKAKSSAPTVVLPFVPASARHVANITGGLTEVIMRQGVTAIATATQIDRPLPRFKVPIPKLVTVLPAQFLTHPKPLTMEILIRRILSEPFRP